MMNPFLKIKKPVRTSLNSIFYFFLIGEGFTAISFHVSKKKKGGCFSYTNSIMDLEIKKTWPCGLKGEPYSVLQNSIT